MSLFRAGGASGLRAARLTAPVNARFVSNGSKVTPPIKTSPSEAPTATHSSSSLISKQTPAEAMTHHQPDYEATIDHGTSYATLLSPSRTLSLTLWLFHRNFSPVPKRVMDGSEPGENLPAAVLSGAPTDLQARTVRYVGKLDP